MPISVSSFSQEKSTHKVLGISTSCPGSPRTDVLAHRVSSSGNYNDENSDISIRGIDHAVGTSTTACLTLTTPPRSRHIGFGAYNVFPALFDIDRGSKMAEGRKARGSSAQAPRASLCVSLTPQPNLQQNSGDTATEFASTKDGDPSYEVGAAIGGPS